MPRRFLEAPETWNMPIPLPLNLNFTGLPLIEYMQLKCRLALAIPRAGRDCNAKRAVLDCKTTRFVKRWHSGGCGSRCDLPHFTMLNNLAYLRLAVEKSKKATAKNITTVTSANK